MMRTTLNSSLKNQIKSSSIIKISQIRLISSCNPIQANKFDRPSPPPLPPKEQKEFEKLLKEKANLSPFTQNSKNDPESGELHPDARRKPIPDFQGETNPTTGEIGGPKKDPLSWEREWTYGGRATDF